MARAFGWRNWVGVEQAGPVDRWLLGAVLALSAGGLLMVYSSSSALGVVSHRGNDLFYLQSQLSRWLLGVAVMLGLSYLDVRHLSGKLAWGVWGVAVLMLLLLLVPSGPGIAVRGARRWLPIWKGLVQPGEFARLALVVCLASVLARTRHRLHRWGGILPPALLVLLTAGLIALQPHLSLALLTAASGFVLIFLAGASLVRLLLAGSALGGIALLAARGYHLQRVTSFLDGLSGVAGYQVRQSIIGIGSGGLTGLGPGQGMQKHFFLPDPHTDFIFSILGEEFGLVGLVVLFALSGLILVRIFATGRRAEPGFPELLAYGVGLQLAFAFLLHAAVCLGWAPTTGVPCPLVSFGGSALIANLVGIGLVLSVSRRASRGSQQPAYAGPLLFEEPWRAGRLR